LVNIDYDEKINIGENPDEKKCE